MRPLVCTDASLALKVVLHEPDSALARALWETWKSRHVQIIAPALWGYEVTSVIRNRVHRGLIPADLGEEAFAAVHQLPVQLVLPNGLHQQAWAIACRFDRPAAMTQIPQNRFFFTKILLKESRISVVLNKSFFLGSAIS